MAWKKDWCLYCGHPLGSGVAAPKVARFPDPEIESTESVELEEIEREEQDPYTARRILLFVWRVVCAVLCGAIGAIVGAVTGLTGMMPLLALLGVVAGYFYGSTALLVALAALGAAFEIELGSHSSGSCGSGRRRRSLPFGDSTSGSGGDS